MTPHPLVPNQSQGDAFAAIMDAFLAWIALHAEELEQLGFAWAASVTSSSTTSLTLAPGVQSLVVEPGRGYAPGMDIVLAYRTTPTVRMIGTVLTYNGVTGALEADVYGVQGAGTHADWVVTMNPAIDASMYVTLLGVQALENKTLIAPVLDGATGTLVDVDLQGTVTADTPAANADNQQVATTEFVNRAAAAGKIKAFAAEALEAGQAVVLNADGTLAAIGTANAPDTLQAEGNFGAATTWTVQAAIDIPNSDQIAVLTSTGYLYLATVDAATGTVTLGNGVLAAAANASMASLAWHPTAGLAVVVYPSSASTVVAVAYNVGGATPVVSIAATSVGVTTVTAGKTAITYNADQDRLVIACAGTSTSTVAFVAARINAGVFTFGTKITTAVTANYDNDLKALVSLPGTPKVFAVYSYDSTKSYGAVLTINANTLALAGAASLGANTFFSAGHLVRDNVTGRLVWIGWNASTPYYVVIAPADTSFVAGAVTAFPGVTSAASFRLSAHYDPIAQKVIVAHPDASNYCLYTPCSVDAATNLMVLGTAVVINNASSTYFAAVYDATSQQTVFFFLDAGDSSYLHARACLFGALTTTADAWVGLTATAIAAAAEGYVYVPGGLCTSVSGLTPGLTYYLDDHGDLQVAGDRIAGVALASDKLLLLPSGVPPSERVPAPANYAGRFLATDGVSTYWALPIPDQYGQGGKVLWTDGESAAWVDWIAGQLRLTADGAIAAGAPVVLNGDGTVSPIAYTEDTGSLGAETVHSAATTTYLKVVNLPGTNKIAVLYAVGSTYYLVVGDVDAGTGVITFGAAVATAATTAYCDLVWHPTEGLVFVYLSSTTLYRQLGTVTGTAISLGAGTSLGLTSVASRTLKALYNAHQDKVALAWSSTSTTVGIVPIHIAAGAFTIGSTLTVNTGTGAVLYASCNVGGAPYVLVSSYDTTNNHKVYCIEINATTAYNRSNIVANSATTQLIWDGTAAKALASTGAGAWKVLTLTGSTLASPYNGASIPGMANLDALAFDSTKGKLVAFGREATTSYGVAVKLALEPAAMAAEAPVYVNSSVTSAAVIEYVGNNDRAVAMYQDNGNLSYGTYRVWDTGDSISNADLWLGFAQAAIADGTSGFVAIKGGVATALAGLTTGLRYYLADNGTLQQTGSRVAGVALSPTSLQLTGMA